MISKSGTRILFANATERKHMADHVIMQVCVWSTLLPVIATRSQEIPYHTTMADHAGTVQSI